MIDGCSVRTETEATVEYTYTLRYVVVEPAPGAFPLRGIAGETVNSRPSASRKGAVLRRADSAGGVWESRHARQASPRRHPRINEEEEEEARCEVWREWS